MKWNIKIKTEGLTEKENEEIRKFIRMLRRKGKCENRRISFRLKAGEKTYAIR